MVFADEQKLARYCSLISLYDDDPLGERGTLVRRTKVTLVFLCNMEFPHMACHISPFCSVRQARILLGRTDRNPNVKSLLAESFRTRSLPRT